MLVLASSSPRRVALLKEWGYAFRIVEPAADETWKDGLPEKEIVRRLAERKALSGVEKWREAGGGQEDIVLAADTVVVLDGTVLGKPGSREEAAAMLTRLSGRVHDVLTGIAICRLCGEKEIAVVESRVHFKKLTQEMIAAYVRSGDSLDKAGAYGIQGEAGKFVARLDGSLTNVIGLPMEFLQQRLNVWGIASKKDPGMG
ncbi:MAG: Maf family protein [Peptococcaceae bacterium]|jgi:septum formation protein|nr:Maf family protein [Peptococcaceae bacterium]